jgi:hypothetical protein
MQNHIERIWRMGVLAYLIAPFFQFPTPLFYFINFLFSFLPSQLRYLIFLSLFTLLSRLPFFQSIYLITCFLCFPFLSFSLSPSFLPASFPFLPLLSFFFRHLYCFTLVFMSSPNQLHPLLSNSVVALTHSQFI